MHGSTSITDPLDQPIVGDTWREKYAHHGETDWADTCRRVIRALCANETQEFTQRAFQAMLAREIVPAGRILAGAGTDKRVTLINCFVSPDIQDSMQTHPEHPGAGIMDALSKAAYTLQMGGGIGMDFSTIRPRGSVVKRTSSVSSGVLPFMDMWHYMSETIMSAGHRRGAMMGTLGIWHPDIEEFIEAKQQKGRLTNFNVSVLVPDDFMRKVAKDKEWCLRFPVQKADGSSDRQVGQLSSGPAWQGGFIYKTLSARELWNKIIAATYVHAEPGVIFIDRVNQLNNLAYCEHIHCSNPCGEQMLPANGDCNLGHTNLAVMVDNPFTERAVFNFGKLVHAATTMVRLLDNVLDVTQWPTTEQRDEAMAKRRVGLGFTGLASALQQLGIPYGSEVAVKLTSIVARQQAVAAYEASAQLAAERGAFPLFDADKFLRAPFVEKLPNETQRCISYNGIRNGVLLSIAPTGTTSLVTGNVSSGIEPVFAHSYKRRVRGNSGGMTREYAVYDYGYLKWCKMQGLDPSWPVEGEPKVLPVGFVTADHLTVEQHLQMAAAAQEWVDSAISKTINCPTSMDIEEFRAVYTRAYELGLKGCTTYRPDPRSGRGAVLEATSPEQPEMGRGADHDVTAAQHAHSDRKSSPEKHAPSLRTEQALAYGQDKVPMQDVVEGRRYRIKWPTEDCAYYVVITDVSIGGHRRPFELFISTKSERHSEWVKAFSLLVTAIFRREGDPSFVVDELKSVFAATGGSWMKVSWQDKPKLATSLVAAIGLKVEEHLRWLGMIAPEDNLVRPLAAGGDIGPALAGVVYDDSEKFEVSEPLIVSPDDTIAVRDAGETLTVSITENAVTEQLMPAAELLDVCDHCGARAVVYAEGCATCHACGRSDCG